MHSEAEWGEDGDSDDELDALETAMLGEGRVGGGLGPALERNLASGKMNFSQKASNEMTAADNYTDKRANHTGRDDRATNEQVTRNAAACVLSLA